MFSHLAEKMNIKTSIDQYRLFALNLSHLIYAGSTKPDDLIKKQEGRQESILRLKRSTNKQNQKLKRLKQIKIRTNVVRNQ